MSVLWGGVGPQVNKFKQVSSDHHQMSVAEGSWVGNMSGVREEGVPMSQCTCSVDRITDGQTPVKTIHFPKLCLRAVMKQMYEDAIVTLISSIIFIV